MTHEHISTYFKENRVWKMTREEMTKFIAEHLDEFSEFLSNDKDCWSECPVHLECCKFMLWHINPTNEKPDDEEMGRFKELCCYVTYCRILQNENGRW